jgi:hypothetical protein
VCTLDKSTGKLKKENLQVSQASLAGPARKASEELV